MAPSWQKVRVRIDAPPRGIVQIDPTKLPCQIWIKSASWLVGGKEIPAAIRPGLNGIVEDFGGQLRLTLYGAAPMLTQMPNVGPAEFEMEFMIASGYAALVDIIGRMRLELDANKSMRARAPAAAWH